MDAEKFASHARSLAKRWLEPKRKLAELQAACWAEVAFGLPVFDRAEREAAVLGTISQEDLVALFEGHLARSGSPGRACLVAAVAPWEGAPADEAAALCRAFGGERGT